MGQRQNPDRRFLWVSKLSSVDLVTCLNIFFLCGRNWPMYDRKFNSILRPLVTGWQHQSPNTQYDIVKCFLGGTASPGENTCWKSQTRRAEESIRTGHKGSDPGQIPEDLSLACCPCDISTQKARGGMDSTCKGPVAGSNRQPRPESGLSHPGNGVWFEDFKFTCGHFYVVGCSLDG